MTVLASLSRRQAVVHTATQRPQGMHGSRKFCQRGSNFDIFLVDEGSEDRNTTISGLSSIRQRDDDPTLNTGLVALCFSGESDKCC